MKSDDTNDGEHRDIDEDDDNDDDDDDDDDNDDGDDDDNDDDDERVKYDCHETITSSFLSRFPPNTTSSFVMRISPKIGLQT